MNRDHLGLISSPRGGGHYIVAQLQQILGHGKAILLRFSSEAGEWVTRFIGLTPPRPQRRGLARREALVGRPLLVPPHMRPIRGRAGADSRPSPGGQAAQVHGSLGSARQVPLRGCQQREAAVRGHVLQEQRCPGQRLDAWCLLTCDPFADEPVLTAVPLPEGKQLKFMEAWGVLDKYRCVGVSSGKLRFADMYSRNSAAQVSVWTLADPDTTEWKLEYEATFAGIWGDASYKGSAQEDPRACAHPPHQPGRGLLLPRRASARRRRACSQGCGV
uniref:DUF1618 domain-containing protein n=1 Tax=Triticum urartu TaxID=4572 RepID=A0A8R7RCI0_TRIUA